MHSIHVFNSFLFLLCLFIVCYIYALVELFIFGFTGSINCFTSSSFFFLLFSGVGQVLGDKPPLSEGGDDDDTEADMSNRKMAKLYMVQYYHQQTLKKIDKDLFCLIVRMFPQTLS